jgi:phosphate transport system protein
MSHYEERLERDLGQLREHIATMGRMVEDGIKNAMHALQTGNKKLAAATILADHPVNRSMREIDHLCHSFIALHLPTAGHLRLLSSVIRVNIQLERIGDYAVTIAREALHSSSPPSGQTATELERVSIETRLMLHQSIEAFNSLNADNARTTMVMEEQIENNLDIFYAELLANGDHESVKRVLANFDIFNQLKRVADQAKNICEETVFAATGETKTPKVYNILFLDEDNSCLSQMAAAIAEKNFPGSGVYSSAGRQPAAALNPAMVGFLDQHGISLKSASPAALELTPLELTTLHFIISLQGPVASSLKNIPFHTTPMEWDIGPAPTGTDSEDTSQRLEQIYRDTAVQVRDLMQILRGKEAP